MEKTDKNEVNVQDTKSSDSNATYKQSLIKGFKEFLTKQITKPEVEHGGHF